MSYLFSLLSICSAFLLFSVQPLMAKSILPILGGTSSAWATSVFFFQVLLCLGYLSAHFLISANKTKRLQPIAIISFSLFLFFADVVLPSQIGIKEHDVLESPVYVTFLALLRCIGFQFFFISLLSPTFQSWFYRIHPNRNPYFLYSWSNFGSFLALLGYPLLIEPTLTLTEQASLWSVTLRCLALAIIFVAIFMLKNQPSYSTEATPSMQQSISKSYLSWGWWLCLSALSSFSLVAVTTHITEDIAQIPLLWIAPLALYLVSYIVCFSDLVKFKLDVWIALLFLSFSLWGVFSAPSLLMPMLNSLAMFFAICMICHGELYRQRPLGLSLTRFYATSSVGSVMGSAIAVILTPLILKNHNDFFIAASVTAGLAIVFRADRNNPATNTPVGKTSRLKYVIYALLATLILGQVLALPKGVIELRRNFFGSLSVQEERTSFGIMRKMSHGSTLHGAQLIDNPSLPLSYYHSTSTYASVVNYLHQRGPLDICVIGLGTGAVSAFSEFGDRLLFIDINPLVRELALKHFSYLKNSKAALEFLDGDGRTAISNLPPERKFDLILIDAFSSDSIPTHLLTLEAMQVYLQHLKNNGIILLHISHRYLDLSPVAASIGKALDLDVLIVKLMKDLAPTLEAVTIFAVISPNPEINNSIQFDPRSEKFRQDNFLRNPWTDNFSNIVEIMRR